MSEFFASAFTFPTAIFSALLIPVLLYWISVILGAADLDLVDGMFEGLDGGVEGLDGLGSGDVDADLDGHGDGVLAALGLAGVPLTVSLSLLVFFGWFLTFSAMELFGHLELGILGGTLLAVVILALSTLLSFVLTAAVATRLRPAFVVRGAIGRSELVDKICLVTTQRVDENFGQAEVLDDDGASLLIQVRSTPDNAIARGQRALIYKYQRDDEVFWISPLDKALE